MAHAAYERRASEATPRRAAWSTRPTGTMEAPMAMATVEATLEIAAPMGFVTGEMAANKRLCSAARQLPRLSSWRLIHSMTPSCVAPRPR